MKKLVVIILNIVLILSISACGTESQYSEGDDVSLSTNEEVVNNGKEFELLDGENISTETKNKIAVKDTTQVVAIGEAVTIEDRADFYIDYIDITNDVIPPSPGSWYSHYEAENGKAFVDICVAYKNLSSGNIDADDTISGLLFYDNRYEYTGFSIIEEDNRSDFTYSNITSIAPLTTEYLHYLFSVPEEVQNTNKSIKVNMKIGGSDYKVIVREGSGEVDQNGSENSKTLSKTSGAVINGESVTTANAEFYVDYSNITNDVIPPSPGDWYTHYEAEVGKAYVDFCLAYKNTSGKNVDADSVVSANLKYANKYEYTGFSIIEEDNRSDFTYSNITSIAPLSTEYMHYLFAIPDDVVNSSDSIEISFSIDGNEYTYNVR